MVLFAFYCFLVRMNFLHLLLNRHHLPLWTVYSCAFTICAVSSTVQFINHSSIVASGKIRTELGSTIQQIIQHLAFREGTTYSSQTCFHGAEMVLAINPVHQVYRSGGDATRKIATLERLQHFREGVEHCPFPPFSPSDTTIQSGSTCIVLAQLSEYLSGGQN